MAANQIATGAFGAGQGALSGAMAGSVVPGIGTAVGAVIGTVVGGLTGVLSGGAGADAKKAQRAQKRSIRRQGAARMRDLYRESQALLGTQKTGYAAAGVYQDVGSAALAQTETRNEFARQQSLTAYLTKQQEKGADAVNSAQRTSIAAGYTSDVMQLSQLAYSFNSGRPTPSGKAV